MKIYTKAGDRGKTSLLGGSIVPKDHPRLEACGTVDELNSMLGLLRDQVPDKGMEKTLLIIQDRIMTGSAILSDERMESESGIPRIKEEDILFLEKKIDEMNQVLEPLRHFILPGGHTIVSYCHMTRAICRRAERQVVKFIKDSRQLALFAKYLNRLSDFLFVQARKIARDFNIEEILWQAK